MSTSLGIMSRKARKFVRGFTRYERRKKFEAQGRICCFCGLVADSAKACTVHEQSPRHVEDRVERARQRMNAEAAEKRLGAEAA